MRHYIVLKRVDGTGGWQEVTVLEARTRRAALRKVEQAGTSFGEYVAVPLGQWKVMPIPAETPVG